MQSVINHTRFASKVITIMLTAAFLATNAPKNAAWNDQEPIELTKADLLSLPGWEHKEVAIDGFFIGMTREQASEVAKARNLRFRSDRPRSRAHEGCDEMACSVEQVNGNWIGIDLSFEADRLVKIKVSVPVDADPEVKAVNIAREFKGRTYLFFNSYSDDLRNQTFGPAEGKETPIKAGSRVSKLSYVAYEYLHSGVIIHVTIDKNEYPPKPFDLEVDFVRHQ